MPKTIGYFFLFFIVAACVEPYHFVIPDATPSLVVEAYLSDKSYKETLTYPSDGRFFTVKLSYTSDVINTPSQEVSLAVVELHSDRNEVWKYTELTDTPGLYGLLDSLFEAEAGVRYKLHIQLPDEEIYESEWEGLPTTEPPPMGTVGFEEIMIKKICH